MIKIILKYKYPDQDSCCNTRKSIKTFSLLLTISVDISLLVGIYLYYKKWQSIQEGVKIMQNEDLRKKLVEHAPMMLIAIILIHIAGKMIKKNIVEKNIYKKVMILYLIALIIILSQIPSWTLK